MTSRHLLVAISVAILILAGCATKPGRTAPPGPSQGSDRDMGNQGSQGGGGYGGY
ncbi:MAG TPA: hypothetical protein VGO04_03570 [Ensifer sp.]|uniref:hypothetical protein n=1 Tax=Ensifer sp. TaxID=1872086 RepID=UPI002E124581|nr:hypothetical protein [Ensifer sp.]